MELAVRQSAERMASRERLLRASIIIVNYNAKEKLLRCLESVMCSSQPDCEVIVMDNDSSDGIADVIETDFPDSILPLIYVYSGDELCEQMLRGCLRFYCDTKSSVF